MLMLINQHTLLKPQSGSGEMDFQRALTQLLGDISSDQEIRVDILNILNCGYYDIHCFLSCETLILLLYCENCESKGVGQCNCGITTSY